ncbi:uncharacterized protein N7483_010641 [Penicillium malachiteum]|uniref:uncharacterized protein n=1 Tax=Penicillium malachiteum TaxID=1324776 RepID=UPI002548B26D|nr:uncharacterized protein N7483_010641 [Penicillium malachiteum]KAJ5713460.1 hypothetical protein N7483_010641 [Penicillium malachiteum]
MAGVVQSHQNNHSKSNTRAAKALRVSFETMKEYAMHPQKRLTMRWTFGEILRRFDISLLCEVMLTGFDKAAIALLGEDEWTVESFIRLLPANQIIQQGVYLDSLVSILILVAGYGGSAKHIQNRDKQHSRKQSEKNPKMCTTRSFLSLVLLGIAERFLFFHLRYQ